MNRKNLPMLFMLTAGAITCIVTYVMDYSVVAKLTTLFAMLVLFYLFGSVLKWTLDFFERQNEEKQKEEGEVIEKDGSEENTGEQETSDKQASDKKQTKQAS